MKSAVTVLFCVSICIVAIGGCGRELEMTVHNQSESDVDQIELKCDEEAYGIQHLRPGARHTLGEATWFIPANAESIEISFVTNDEKHEQSVSLTSASLQGEIWFLISPDFRVSVDSR